MWPDRPDLRSDTPDLGSERPNLGSERPDLRYRKSGLKLQKRGMDRQKETGENRHMVVQLLQGRCTVQSSHQLEKRP